MALKKFKKKQKLEKVVVPNFYIVRWMMKGKEMYRCLIDDHYYLSWTAFNSREKSIEEAVRYKLWGNDYKDSTYEFIVKVKLECETKKSREKNKLILETVLEYPFCYIDSSITYLYEPMDDDLLEQVVEVQNDYFLAIKIEKEEQLKAEKEQLRLEAENEKKSRMSNLRNRLSKRILG